MKKSYWLAVQIVMAVVLSSVLLAGCGKKEVSSTDVVISDVAMSTAVDGDNRPIAPTNVFAADTPAIICSFEISNFPVGATMNAKLVYVDGELEGVLGEQVGTMESEGGGRTSIVWLRSSMIDDIWPKGDYKVVLSVQGKEEASASFKVE